MCIRDSFGAALGDDTAEVQHADALADVHDQIHVMLDVYKRQAS